jgi:hypothetical protein
VNKSSQFSPFLFWLFWVVFLRQSLNPLQVAQTEANRSNRQQQEANTSKRKQNYAQINTKVFSLPHSVFIIRRCLGAVESEGLFQNEVAEAELFTGS